MPNTTTSYLNADTTFKHSTWTGSARWQSTARHGQLIPMYTFEVLPSDIWDLSIDFHTRMNQLITSVYGDFYQNFAAFFTPKRIIWDYTKQFYGEADDFGVGFDYTEPTLMSDDYVLTRDDLDPWVEAENEGEEGHFDASPWSTFGSAFGLVTNLDSLPAFNKRIPINMLPIWAFGAIYNVYFRNENYQSKYMWDKGSSGPSLYGGYMYLGYDSITAKSQLPSVNKQDDLFTTILPYALKTDEPVTIPLGESAPVNIESDGLFYFKDTGHSEAGKLGVLGTETSEGSGLYNAQLGVQQGTENPPSNVWGSYDSGLKATVDLSQATAASLTSLINAINYQFYYSQLAKGGSKYGEYLKIMFGSNCPAATRDEPEFLGHYVERLNVDTVLQTTGQTFDADTGLGAIGANSQTKSSNSKTLVHGAFTEPGYLTVVTYFKHKRIYSTAINPIFLKSTKFDYFNTPFANMPDVSFDSEIMYFTGSLDSRKSLGFAEPWFDYKRFFDAVYGGMNPQNPKAFAYLTMAEKFDNQPTITGEFLKEDRGPISRALASGENGFDYICDVIANIKLSRVMPFRSNGLGVL